MGRSFGGGSSRGGRLGPGPSAPRESSLGGGVLLGHSSHQQLLGDRALVSRPPNIGTPRRDASEYPSGWVAAPSWSCTLATSRNHAELARPGQPPAGRCLSRIASYVCHERATRRDLDPDEPADGAGDRSSDVSSTTSALWSPTRGAFEFSECSTKPRRGPPPAPTAAAHDPVRRWRADRTVFPLRPPCSRARSVFILHALGLPAFDRQGPSSRRLAVVRLVPQIF